MDETIYVILKVLFSFALEVWFSIGRQNEPKKICEELGIFTLFLKLFINFNKTCNAECRISYSIMDLQKSNSAYQ